MTNVIYWNCASGLVKKLDFVKDKFISKDTDILFVSEVEITDKWDRSFLEINGFDLHLSETLLTKGKSRLLCFARQNCFKLLSPHNKSNEVLILQQGKTIIAGVYRGFQTYENETERSNWVRLIDELSHLKLSSEVFIVGDLNVNLNNSKSRFLRELNEWSDSYSLNVINLGITRRRAVAGNLQESNLDIVVTNSSRFTSSTHFNELSDHAVVRLKIHHNNISVNRSCRSFTSVNWNFDADAAGLSLLNYLNTSPDMSSSRVVDLDYGIRAGLAFTFSRFIQSRELTVKSDRDIVSIKITKLKNRKCHLRKVWVRDNNHQSWINYINAKKQLRSEVRKCRAAQLKKNLGMSTKHFWSEINQLMGKHSKTISKLVW